MMVVLYVLVRVSGEVGLAIQCTPLCKLDIVTNPIFLADVVGERLFSSSDRYGAVFQFKPYE